MAEGRDAIVVSCDANWLPAAAVALRSVAMQGVPPSADLIAIVRDPTLEDRSNFDRFNARHDTALRLLAVHMDPPPEVNLRHWGVGAVLMLRLDEHLPSTYRRVLHLDADILALRPIGPLLETNLDGNCLGAVDELWWLTRRGQSVPPHLGLPPGKSYFNNGVLVFDWAATLRDKLLPRALSLLGNGRDWPFIDQDVLNLATAGQWRPLDPRWNITNGIDGFRHITPWIRHFTTPAKPWTPQCDPTDRKYQPTYIDALADLPWQSFVVPGAKTLRLDLFGKRIQHKLAFNRQRQLTRYLRDHSAIP